MAKASKYSNKTETKTEAPKVDAPKVEAKAETKEVSAAHKGHVSALAFVREAGVQLNNVLVAYANAKEAETLGPINVFCFFELGLSEDAQSMIPEVGSKQGETGNLPYDRYSQKIQTDKGERTVPGSWFTDVRDSLPEREAIDQRIAWCKGQDNDTMPDDIRKMGTGERGAEVKRLNNRLKYMRRALTEGAMLRKHVEKIGAINPERITVKMPFRMDQSERGYTVFSNIIRLKDPTDVLEDKTFTVSEFLSLDPAKIPQGTVADLATLEATKARKPRQTKKAGKQGGYTCDMPKSLENLLVLFNVGATSMDQNTEEGKMLYSKVLAACAAPGQAGDDVVETIGDFISGLDDNIWGIINARYNLIKANKAKAQNIKAATQHAA